VTQNDKGIALVKCHKTDTAVAVVLCVTDRA